MSKRIASAQYNFQDPTVLARFYEATGYAVEAARREGVLPRDIESTWPNCLGFMRRVPGQGWHRPSTRGDDTPTEREIHVFGQALAIHKRRCEDAIRNKGVKS